MRKGQVAIWTIATLALAWGLFALVMPLFNREKSAGALDRAYRFLLIPVIAQIVWLAAGGAYSAWRKRREAITGIVLGFGLEIVTLVVLVIISASAHY